MKLSDFQVREFYSYKIRSVVVNNIEMFLVSELVSQYNKVNNTNKKLKYYLENKQTREFLNELCIEEGCGSSHTPPDNQNHCISVLNPEFI